MPRIGSRCLVWAFVSCLGLWVILGQGQEASANLSYRGSWESNENEEGRLLQSYVHVLNLSSKQDLNERLTSDEYVGYSYRWEQEGTSSEILSPGASLRLSGDIFIASVAVNSNKSLNSQTTQLSSDTLALNWASAWQKKFYPDFRASYDYSRQRTDSSINRLDDGRQSIATDVNWDLLIAKLFYSYRRNDSNFVGYQEKSDNNLARVDATRVWLDNRLRVSLGHEYNKTTSERRIPFTSSTIANVLLTLPEVYTGTDPTPNDTDDSMLVAAPFLLNNANQPTLPPGYTVAAVNNPNCLRLRTNGQPVDRIYLYTQTNLGTSLLGVNWRIYTNDNIVINSWSQLVTFTWQYDAINQRFVIDIPAVKANYLKLVVDLVGPITITFTEVQAEQVVHGAIGSTLSTIKTDQSDKSNFSLDFRLNNSVAFFYSLLIEQEKSDDVTINDREGHNGGLRLQNSAGDLKSILSYSLSRQRYWASPESQIETYQLSINKILLPTLTLALSGSRDNTSLDGAKVSTRNRYAFYVDAKLYPDLASQLEAVYWDSKSTGSGLGTVLGGGNQDNLSTKFTVTSRFSPSLNVSFYDTYEVNNQTDVASKRRNTVGVTTNWQASDLLSIYASVARESDSLAHDASIYSTGLVAGMGSALELKASYSLRLAENKFQTGLVSLRWTSNQHVYWEIGCNYAETDDTAVTNVYKFYSKVVVNFATL